MFVLKQQHVFFWPVKVQVPVDGSYVEQGFEAEFKALSKDRIEALAAEQPDGDAALLRECMVGWRGAVDEEKAPLPVNDEIRAALVGLPYVRTALVAAYFAAIAGRKEKN